MGVSLAAGAVGAALFVLMGCAAAIRYQIQKRRAEPWRTPSPTSVPASAGRSSGSPTSSASPGRPSSLFEKGRYDPSLPLAFRLAGVFERRIEDLFTPDGNAG